ncbi:MAG: heparan-alpha-glucosaminide N-acetyltransferase domain-containing protein [Pirellulaceae bacterium]
MGGFSELSFQDLRTWGSIGNYPFVGFDVLYLIGVAVPLAALAARLAPAWQIAVMVLVVGLAELLRSWLGYSEYVLSLACTNSPRTILEFLPRIGRQWLIAGWFPLFPWLYFSLLGVRIFQWRRAAGADFRRQASPIGLGLVALGLINGWIVKPQFSLRHGYQELFYPPTSAYVLVASGIVLILFVWAKYSWLRANRPLIVMGQCALLLCVAHLTLIHWVIAPWFQHKSMAWFLGLYVPLLAILFGLAEVVRFVKHRFGGRLPFLVRFLLGS